MKKKPYIIGTWKMNLDGSQIERFFSGMEITDSELKKIKLIICPSFPYLEKVKGLIGDRPINLGAQNIFWEDRGAYTGEVSARQLADFGCQYVILGHSERREYFHETNEIVNKKIQLALRYKITPVVCLGESYEEKEAGQTKQIIEQHVQQCIEGLEKRDIQKVIIAYEPVWAISTNIHNKEKKTDSPESAQVVHKLIRRVVANMYDETTAQAMPVIYGGSVAGDSVGGFAAMDDIDGVLVGGASKEIDSFQKVIKAYL